MRPNIRAGGNHNGLCHYINHLKWRHGSRHLLRRETDLGKLTVMRVWTRNKECPVTTTQSSPVARRGSDPSLIWLPTDNSPMTSQVLSQLTLSTPVASASTQRAALSLPTGSAALIFLKDGQTRMVCGSKDTTGISKGSADYLYRRKKVGRERILLVGARPTDAVLWA